MATYEVRITSPHERSFSFVTPDEQGALDVYQVARNEGYTPDTDLLTDGEIVASGDPQRDAEAIQRLTHRP